MSIESMSSQQFSTGIFYFLIVAILIFVGITVMYMFKGKNKTIKTGEKWLFAWILFGVVVAIIFGAAQMMNMVSLDQTVGDSACISMTP